jgi:hypothetical protein
MQVFIRYHVGWLGNVPPSAFENEVRTKLVTESSGRPFELRFESRPGVGFIALDDQVSCIGTRRAECADWQETIGNELIPEAWEALASRYGHAAR